MNRVRPTGSLDILARNTASIFFFIALHGDQQVTASLASSFSDI
jgi:hypothetical protein